jgi:CobB/CobQ-like glutamine amidotransferase domain
MKLCLTALLIITWAGMFCGFACAEEAGSGHYLPGATSSFIDMLPDRGTSTFAYLNAFTYYHGSTGASRDLELGGQVAANVKDTVYADTSALGLLEIETIFQPEKITERVGAIHLATGLPVSGYEIHAGRAAGMTGSGAVFRIVERDGVRADDFEGAHSEDGRVIGSSIHGLFDAAGFRRKFVDTVRESKGLAALGLSKPDDPDADRRTAFDRIADVLEAHVDMSWFAALVGVDWKPSGPDTKFR